ncbi:MAG: SDR family NAD(P)-dependent oxidoreductase, partial [Hyphomicrobiaceae bacterium]
METLKGRVALITGAAGVLGFATAKALAADGMKVVLTDIDDERLQELVGEVDGDATHLVLDVSDPDAAANACAGLAEEFGGVDVLVNNAGVLSNKKAAETSPEEWRRIMAINLDGAFYLSRACLPGMKAKGWGRIVNVCSLAAKTGGLTAGTAYTASK